MPDLDTSRPFTMAEARAAGLTRREVESPRYRRLHHGLYVDADVPLTPRLRAQAALRLHPAGAHVAFQLAAEVYGLPVPSGADSTVVVASERDRRRHARIRCVVRRSPVRLWDGIPVATPEALFDQLAEKLGLVDLVVVGDAMLHRGLTSIAKLRRYLETSAHPGAARAKRALRLMRRGAQSPQETRLRLLLRFAGLPRLETQVEIRDHFGALVRSYDLGHRLAKVAVEYHGDHHRTDDRTWEKDVERHSASDDDGWRIVGVVSKGLNRTPRDTIDRVARALIGRGVEVGPLSDEWTRYFNAGKPVPRT